MEGEQRSAAGVLLFSFLLQPPCQNILLHLISDLASLHILSLCSSSQQLHPAFKLTSLFSLTPRTCSLHHILSHSPEAFPTCLLSLYYVLVRTEKACCSYAQLLKLQRTHILCQQGTTQPSCLSSQLFSFAKI